MPPGVSVRVVAGAPALELIGAARGADLLVVGSRGGGGFARLTMGSVSSQVAHHAPCPVVVPITARQRPGRPRSRPRRVPVRCPLPLLAS